MVQIFRNYPKSGLRIDLGCGRNKQKGCIGVDLHSPSGADIIADITSPIPGLSDGCANYVCCHHVIEHLPIEAWRKVLLEISRLLRRNGEFLIAVPHPACKDSMIHGHVHVITPLFWQNIKNGVIKTKDNLIIDTIEEVPNPLCVKFCEDKKLDFNEWSPFLFDAFKETFIYGHKG